MLALASFGQTWLAKAGLVVMEARLVRRFRGLLDMGLFGTYLANSFNLIAFAKVLAQ